MTYIEEQMREAPDSSVCESVEVTPQAASEQHTHRSGCRFSPAGEEITVTKQCLWRDGKRWLPVMGEFQYARYPRAEWRDELIKMKLGGIDIVATYVFWIHHEEVEGEFDWKGRRSLAAFVRLCGEIGLAVSVRCGPWCHGECRNGGLPDWLLAKDLVVRGDDDLYLRYVWRFTRQIAEQLHGQLWKDGGPVIAIQCENEYDGPAEHLLTLKRIAREAGIDVPLYTRTGWPELLTTMPPGEFLPLFGGYPDGFWDRSTNEMPPGFAANFLFRSTRNDPSVATDQLGVREDFDEREAARYPYFTCELGGGMASSYHRRIRIDHCDIESLSLVKIGCGSNLQGYYMYHGGGNPEGRLTTLQESQATGYWNDLPEKTYDFQAPLGEYGQIRPHYHGLRRLHLFLRDFGSGLTQMTTVLPDEVPRGTDDVDTLRWCARTDGESGYIFVNNYQRLQPMPAKPASRFTIPLSGSMMQMPEQPVTIPANSSFIWPFNMDLSGWLLRYATAQPVCRLDSDEGGIIYVFAETSGVPAEFVFDDAPASIQSATGTIDRSADHIAVRNLKPGTDAAIHLTGDTGATAVSIVLLTEAQSRSIYKLDWLGRKRLILTPAELVVDGDKIRLRANAARDLTVGMYPAPPTIRAGETAIEGMPDGIFQRFDAPRYDTPVIPLHCELVREAGPAREIRMGTQGVAEAPSDADFQAAQVWRIRLPDGLDLETSNVLLRIAYTGDVARLYADGVLLTDHFYNGTVFDVGLLRYMDHIKGELLLKILPLRSDAPIYLAADAWPQASGAQSTVALREVTIVDMVAVELTATEAA